MTVNSSEVSSRVVAIEIFSKEEAAEISIAYVDGTIQKWAIYDKILLLVSTYMIGSSIETTANAELRNMTVSPLMKFAFSVVYSTSQGPVVHCINLQDAMSRIEPINVVDSDPVVVPTSIIRSIPLISISNRVAALYIPHHQDILLFELVREKNDLKHFSISSRIQLSLEDIQAGSLPMKEIVQVSLSPEKTTIKLDAYQLETATCNPLLEIPVDFQASLCVELCCTTSASNTNCVIARRAVNDATFYVVRNKEIVGSCSGMDCCFTKLSQGNLALFVLDSLGQTVTVMDVDAQPIETVVTMKLPNPAKKILETPLVETGSQWCTKLLYVFETSARYDILAIQNAQEGKTEKFMLQNSEDRVSCLLWQPSRAAPMLAVQTCHSVHLLSSSLEILTTYQPESPKRLLSCLWFGESLIVYNSFHEFEYFTRNDQRARYIGTCCTLSADYRSAEQPHQLTAVLYDRFCCSVYNTDTGEHYTKLFPFFPLETVLAGVLPATKSTIEALVCRFNTPQATTHVVIELLMKHGYIEIAHALCFPPDSEDYNTRVALDLLGRVAREMHDFESELRVLLRHNQPLLQYVLDPTAPDVQLPQSSSTIALEFGELALDLEREGWFSESALCYDVAGNDLNFLQMLLRVGPSSNPVLNELRTVYQDLGNISFLNRVEMIMTAMGLNLDENPSVGRRNFSPQSPRREILLQCSSKLPSRRKRIPTPALSVVDETPVLPRLVFDSIASWMGLTPPEFEVNESNVEQEHGGSRFGPFMNDEDSIVGYWRFENALEQDIKTIEDGSPRANDGTVIGCNIISFQQSTAPIDRGDETRVREAHAAQFKKQNVDVSVEDTGICFQVLPGSSLDIGLCYSDNFYRRSSTFELWLIRSTNSSEIQSISSRRQAGQSLYELFIEGGLVKFKTSDQLLTSDVEGKIDVDVWVHAAFSCEILSSTEMQVNLYVAGKLTCSQIIAPPSYDPAQPSELWIGHQLVDCTLTELRLWAMVRTTDMIQDLMDTYLTLAERKKKINVNIHQKDCTCDKCQRRAAKGTVQLGLPPPSRRLMSPKAPHKNKRSNYKALVLEALQQFNGKEYSKSEATFEKAIKCIGKVWKRQSTDLLRAQLLFVVNYRIALRLYHKLQSDTLDLVTIGAYATHFSEISLQRAHHVEFCMYGAKLNVELKNYGVAAGLLEVSSLRLCFLSPHSS